MNGIGWVLYRCGPESCIVGERRQMCERCRKTSIDGEVFVFLHFVITEGIQLPIRAVLGSNRLMLLNLTYY